MVATSKNLMTADELLAMPDPGDGTHYELLDGALLTMPPSSEGHGVVAGRIATCIGAADMESRRGELIVADAGYKLTSNPDTVLAPDVAFLVKERVRPREQRKGFPPGAPDLAVEVLSPSNTATEMLRKVNLYLESGSRIVWLVDPDAETVAVYERGKETRFLHAEDEIDGGDVLPEFRARVGDFFV